VGILPPPPEPVMLLGQIRELEIQAEGTDQDLRLRQVHRVEIARESAITEYGGMPLSQRIWRMALRITIGYGYRPLRALWWILMFVTIGTALFGDADPAEFLYRGRPYVIKSEGGRHVLEVALPFTSREELQLSRNGDEMLIQIGGLRRSLQFQRAGQAAATLLIAGSAITLGRLLAGAAPLSLLKIGVIAMATSLVYDALNHGPNVVFLRTPIDDLIPVVGPFVIPYVSLRPFLYGSALVFLFFRARIYRSAAISMTVVLLISYVFYVFMQSYIDRPVLLGDDLFSRMIRDVYAGDQPYNDFPSLHASLSTVFAIHWWRVDRRIGLAVAIWVALIVVSTVFVKQHYVADMIAGTALAFLVSRVSLARLVDRGTAAR